MPLNEAEKRGRRKALDGIDEMVARARRNYLLAKLRPAPVQRTADQGAGPDAVDELAALLEAPPGGG